MQLLEVLRVLDASLVAQDCKVHLAGWSGKEDPLDVFFEGGFEDWQCWQTRQNFNRPLVISLIALPNANQWLFAGVHEVLSVKWSSRYAMHKYRMKPRVATESLCGRLVVHFVRKGRQPYRKAENCSTDLLVHSLLPERLAITEFPGYANVAATKQVLDVVVGQDVTSWRTALENVAGVYLIVDRKTGQQYVGSATGEGGIWSRWCEYSDSGHGGNRDLRRLLRERGDEYALNFQFGILEIADRQSSTDHILRREQHWKELLLTREHGLNAK